jgi:hypothetical protein
MGWDKKAIRGPGAKYKRKECKWMKGVNRRRTYRVSRKEACNSLSSIALCNEDLAAYRLEAALPFTIFSF